LPAETVALLHRYFDAFAQLYGILPLQKALDIYNQQNAPLDEQSFSAFSEIVRHERHDYSILGPSDLYANEPGPDAPMNREIIEESLLIDEEGYPEMKAAQREKPYYIPAKNELLRYADEHYYEKNDAFMALREFLLQHMKLPLERAEDIADELQLHASTAESNMQYIMDDMQRMGLEFKGLEDLQLFMARFMEMSNNTRMPINRGHTPMELRGRSGAPRSIQLGTGILDAVRRGEMDMDELRRGVSKMNFPNLEMQISYLKELERIEREVGGKRKVPEAPAPKAKVGRNEPCPCGSGKKYKHCCGKNS
jgi:hypothetical protein